MASKKSSDGLTKIGPGKWRARITARDPVTKKKSLDTDRIIHADTKLEALAKRKALRDEIVGAGDEWTVSEALDAWLPTMRAGTLHTRKTHAKRIRAAFGNYRLSLVPPADVQRWLARMQCSDDTANYHRASLQALYAFARAQGRLNGANPIAATQRRRALGIELDSVTHAMRHTHVTVARALESDAVLRESVGHDERMTERYTDESHRAKVAVSHAGKLERLLAGDEHAGKVVQIKKTTR